MKSARALLILEDGAVFEGVPFARKGKAIGETVFYTGVVGYQEVLTDPSYGGTLSVLTYPIIGSYGVNDEDNESPDVHVRGVVLKQYSRHVSNFRATGRLEEFLIERGVVGIQGVDTRAVVVHLREHGEMKGMIVPSDADLQAAAKELAQAPSPWEGNLVKDLPLPEVPKPVGGVKHRLVALNLGIKNSCLAQLGELGCEVKVLPAGATAGDVIEAKADGLIAAGGPGNPRVLTGEKDVLKTLLGRMPILGMGLGHELLALALGCHVKRMKAGHHGVNHSVRCLADGVSEITSQHHSFVVEAEPLPADVEVTHRNVNDGSVEGIRSTKHPAASVQFHPARDDWGKPNKIFEQFLSGL